MSFIELKTRRVIIAGVTRHAAEAARSFLHGARYLICDNDRRYSRRFKIVMESSHGIQLVRTPVAAPDADAHAERLLRSIKEECLNKVAPFGEVHLRRVLGEYVVHYHTERNHQGVGNELIEQAKP